MHILKIKTEKHKGILVITHKEFNFFKNKFEELSRDYYIIYHLGFNINVPYDKNIDLYMVPKKIKKINCVTYTTRNFTPEFFIRDTKKIKEIDFLVVSRCCKIKNTIETYNFFSKTKYSVCFIILNQYQNENDRYYESFKKLKKAQNITIIDTTNMKNNKFLGLSMEKLSEYYKKSKVYFHNCLNEGESRTIHEAFCSGNIIMSREEMKGPGNDYKNNNYVLYNEKNVFDKMKEALIRFENFDLKDYEKGFEQLSVKYTIEKFKNEICNRLNIDEKNFFTKDLNLKLSSHYLNVPWAEKLTSDILTEKKYDIFCKVKRMDEIAIKIVEKVNKDGFYVLENYFEEDTLKNFDEEFERVFNENEDKIEILDKEECSKDERIFYCEKYSKYINDNFSNNYLFNKVSEMIVKKIKKKCMLNKLEYKEGEIRNSGAGWHRDNHNKQFKIIIYLTDVTEENGNFMFLTNSSKKYIGFPKPRTNNYNTRFTDDTVQELIEKNNCEIINIIGKKGTIIFVDTTYIHRGNIIKKGIRKAITQYYV